MEGKFVASAFVLLCEACSVEEVVGWSVDLFFADWPGFD